MGVSAQLFSFFPFLRKKTEVKIDKNILITTDLIIITIIIIMTLFQVNIFGTSSRQTSRISDIRIACITATSVLI